MARRSELAAAAMPGLRDAMALSISTMIRGYLSVRLDAEDARKAVALYVSTVASFPNWVVDQACRAAVNRPSAFPVSPGELRAICLEVMAPVQDERGAIDAVLDAVVSEARPESDRARMKDAFSGLLSDLRGAGTIA